jgi:uncharacterized protein YggU (UPF0235/DUF167 family)
MKVKVIAHPGAFAPRVEQKEDGLHVYVHDRPEHDLANKAITQALAKYFGVPAFEVELKTGYTSQIKYFEIHDLD